MTDIRRLLDRALPPQISPMTITRDSAISAGRRARRRRRACVAATSAVAVLPVIAGAALLTEGPYGRAEPAGPLPATSVTTVTAAPDPTTSVGPTMSAAAFAQTPRPVTEPTYAALARLTNLMRMWAAHSLSGFSVSDVGLPADPDWHPALTFESIDDKSGASYDDKSLAAGAVLTDAKGTGDVGVTIWTRGSIQDTRDFNTICAETRNVLTCETRIGLGGEHIAIRRVRMFLEDPRIVFLFVEVSKADGTEIIAQSSNVAAGSPDTVRAEPPLDPDQLLGLVLDPGFTLYP
jgi:hypothetical protein